jgi:hypothetical protein
MPKNENVEILGPLEIRTDDQKSIVKNTAERPVMFKYAGVEIELAAGEERTFPK